MDGWLKELQSKGKKVYSQGPQDGYLEYIFENIGTTNKFCVEFGFNCSNLVGELGSAGECEECSGSNTAKLILEDGWTPLLLDGRHQNVAINLHKEYVTPENIADLFKKYGVPNEPDYTSIDIDSVDLWVFRSMLASGYRPRVVSVEHNAAFPITVSATVKLGTTWEGNATYGASLLALNTVAEEFGYQLVCVADWWDAFFIRGDLISEKINIDEFPKFSSCSNIMGLHPTPDVESRKAFIHYPSLEPIKTPWDV